MSGDCQPPWRLSSCQHMTIFRQIMTWRHHSYTRVAPAWTSHNKTLSSSLTSPGWDVIRISGEWWVVTLLELVQVNTNDVIRLYLLRREVSLMQYILEEMVPLTSDHHILNNLQMQLQEIFQISHWKYFKLYQWKYFNSFSLLLIETVVVNWIIKNNF